MAETTRNRLIGLALLVVGILWIGVSPDLSEEIDKVISILVGACVAAGSAILITGDPFWNSDTWWASPSPPDRQ